MLGSSASLLTFDSATRLNYLPPDVATVSPSVTRLNANSYGAFQSNLIQGARASSFSSNKWIVHSSAQVDIPPLSVEEKKTWEACREALSAFEFSTEEKDKMLGKAFGHVHSPYWGEERKQEVPRFESVNEILDYLKNLGLSDVDLQKLVKKFPEVLGCSLEQDLKSNVNILEKVWGIKGKTLRNLLLRNPKVLGYNIDCKGDCKAQCTRCWVRF
ncbi:Mitochondrial transcription termination factor family protein [Euphorbia peplus]|nr:Mitochondrial transcription termination factor family protein [Euphorbia peplus]